MKFWRGFGRGLFYGIGIPSLVVISLASYVWYHYDQKFTTSADCAVVFGAAVWRDDKPSHALYDRTMTGINLVKKQNLNCLILSGGPSKYGADEADVMLKMALESDIQRTIIRLDYDGVNTLATLRNLPKDKTFVFVSNDFHLARIKLLAWKLGHRDFSLQAAQYYQGRYTKESYFFLREVLGVAFYSLLPM